MVTNLATQLKEGTAKSHSLVENIKFIKMFISGVLTKTSYRKLLANLYFIYSSLENEIDKHNSNPLIGPINFQTLHRKKSLEKDLKYYYGENWKSLIKPSKATLIYTQRIEKISAHKPELLIAHAYTRYLGDLSGGQLLKKITKKSLQLQEEGAGLDFYNFKNIENLQEFKKIYKDALNSLQLDRDCTNSIIAEANTAFKLNMSIFQEFSVSTSQLIIMLIKNLALSFLGRENS
ncbi:heme oxygenase (plastid) [Cryptomonas paramecium]|uniref:heme oxygenase (biliverdin-producing) n=1 Tax=Cryptomonas paramaecium TaxID=2898 RepID=D2IS90_9CRYP|nr:heme oxygenase [Cryptomonas paramecium]ACT46782.1 heme oxygenase [Cryptomonas paramecium]BDA98013.1 heme oxygenase [Cryptomonas paramecium]|mmetsp:Transcript_40642/g.108995  ORF Transcript_40642/g.108995 Transcript_40642/m.108995 type:complete len:234 (+) Transcript_40642:72-773(+)